MMTDLEILVVAQKAVDGLDYPWTSKGKVVSVVARNDKEALVDYSDERFIAGDEESMPFQLPSLFVNLDSEETEFAPLSYSEITSRIGPLTNEEEPEAEEDSEQY